MGQEDNARLDRGKGLVFLLCTGLALGEESGRANRFRGSSEVGTTNGSSPASSSESDSRPSASKSEPNSSDVSGTESSSSPRGAGEGDGARPHLREAMSLVVEEVGEHELAVSALLSLSLLTTLMGRSEEYLEMGARVLCFRV